MKTLYYAILIMMLINILSCDKRYTQQETYYMATFGVATMNDNDCGFLLGIDTTHHGASGYRAKVINPPDSVYNGLELEVQFRLLLERDSFRCYISGPVVGSRHKAYPYLEILKTKK